MPGKSPNRTSPIYAFGLAILIFGLSLYLYAEFILWFGFWDGTTSELDRAEKSLAEYVIWLSLLMDVWLIYLGVRAFRYRTGRMLACSVALYAGVMGAAFAIDQYFRAHLMNSAGG